MKRFSLDGTVRIRVLGLAVLLAGVLFTAGCTLPTRDLGVGAVTPGAAVAPGGPGAGIGDAAGGEAVFLPSVSGSTPAVEAQTPTESATSGPPPVYLPQVFEQGTVSPAKEGDEAQPSVALTASAATLQVGETLTVTTQAQNIGLPYFYLHLKNQAMSEAAQIARVTYQNQVTAFTNPAVELSFDRASGSMNTAEFVLTAVQEGRVELNVSVTGEVHTAGGGVWSGASAAPLTIEITPP